MKFRYLNSVEEEFINNHRGLHNKLGLAYQLLYVMQYNHMPSQDGSNIDATLVNLVTNGNKDSLLLLNQYWKSRANICRHQESIRNLYKLTKFTDDASISDFIHEEANKHSKINVITEHLSSYLRKIKMLSPSETELKKVVVREYNKFESKIYSKISQQLSDDQKQQLDDILLRNTGTNSVLADVKTSPKNSTYKAFKNLMLKIDNIKSLLISDIDLSFISTNRKRIMTNYIKKIHITRIRDLPDNVRYSHLICFLDYYYKQLLDDLFYMFDRLLLQMKNRINNKIDKSKINIKTLCRNTHKHLERLRYQANNDGMIHINDIFDDEFIEIHEATSLVLGSRSDKFQQQAESYRSLHKIAKYLPDYLDVQEKHSKILDAIIYLEANQSKQRLESAPVDCFSKKLQKKLKDCSRVEYQYAIMDQFHKDIKSGNLSLNNSYRYKNISEFKMDADDWHSRREEFFTKNKLPSNSDDVALYLTNLLNSAYDKFLGNINQNNFVKFENDYLVTTQERATIKSFAEQAEEDKLRSYINNNIRSIKLTDLLIEVNNQLSFTKSFSALSSKEDIRHMLALIIAQGCNIGLSTMTDITSDIEISKLIKLNDWHFTEEEQKLALGKITNGILNLDITSKWGDGTSSSSDGQRFTMRNRTIKQQYSAHYRDYAVQFYNHVADNYAPFHSQPIECTERDAPYVLDGLLYNESDLDLSEHYTDTSGYSDCNFAAFTMLGYKFVPRIKKIKNSRLHIIDRSRNYGKLNKTLKRYHERIDVENIAKYWDEIARFYASFTHGEKLLHQLL